MDANTYAQWPACRNKSCRGRAFSDPGDCLLHMANDDFSTFLTELESKHETVDMRGTVISTERLEAVLGILRANMPRYCQFDGAIFTGPAHFERVMFNDVSFRLCQFMSIAYFDRALFRGEATFDQARFEGHALFRYVTLLALTSFDSAEFKQDLVFSIGASETYHRVAGGEPLAMSSIRCEGPTSFAISNVPLKVTDSFFAEAVKIELSATFADITDCSFAAPVIARARESILDCTGSHFSQGGSLASNGIVTLAGVSFREAFTLAPPTGGLLGPFTGVQSGSSEAAKPRLLSIQGADVENLTLSNVDLRYCRFVGAHNMDSMRIDGLSYFARPPRGIVVSWTFPPLWHWVRRQVLFEESLWRRAMNGGIADAGTNAQHRRLNRAGEDAPEAARTRARWPVDPQTEAILRHWQWHPKTSPTAAEIAAVYRNLRKSREDAKDEPGAADFYYGEMEMRRKSATNRWERWILTAYWLIAGYSLRGLRALVSLLVVIGVIAILLGVAGFNGDDPSYSRALIYAAQSTLSIASSDKQLTESVSTTGQVLGIILKLSGPLLLALTLLSVRNRVKR